MNTRKEIEELSEYLRSEQMPDSVHKALTLRITKLSERLLDEELTARAGVRYDDYDERIIAEEMDGWFAKTYPEERDKILAVAKRLQRPVDAVKKRLRASGYAAALDAWMWGEPRT